MNKAELTIRDIFHALLSHLVFILIVTVVVGAITWAYTKYKIPKMYQTQVSFLAVSNPESNPNIVVAVEQNASRQLANSCIYILRSNPVMEEVSRRLAEKGVHYSYGQLKGITTVATTTSEYFTATISCTDQKNIKLIADTIGEVAEEMIPEIYGGGKVTVLDKPEQPGAPYSPNVRGNTITGLLVGFLLACIIVIIRALTDTTIWSEEDLAKQCNVPVLGSIPQLSSLERQNVTKE